MTPPPPPRAFLIEFATLAALVATVTCAAWLIDMSDAMTRCQQTHGFAACHHALNR